MNPRPRKPIRKHSVIQFSETGVRRLTEDLPRDQEALELAMGRKFAGAMRRRDGTDLGVPVRGQEPADLVYELPKNNVHVQLVDAVHEPRIQSEHAHRAYGRAVEESCSSALTRLAGCDVEVRDEGARSELPKLSSAEGAALIEAIRKQFEQFADGVSSMEYGALRVARVIFAQEGSPLDLHCMRRRPSESRTPARFRWTGVHVSMPGDRPTPIRDAAHKKIAKGYGKPDGEFWLLIHSVHAHGEEDSRDVAAARRLLRETNHPYDQVWFMWPDVNEESGSIVRLFPSRGEEDVEGDDESIATMEIPIDVWQAGE